MSFLVAWLEMGGERHLALAKAGVFLSGGGSPAFIDCTWK